VSALLVVIVALHWMFLVGVVVGAWHHNVYFMASCALLAFAVDIGVRLGTKGEP